MVKVVEGPPTEWKDKSVEKLWILERRKDADKSSQVVTVFRNRESRPDSTPYAGNCIELLSSHVASCRKCLMRLIKAPMNASIPDFCP